nr:zinc finger, CCHC-type [Tanacetum cinerariifolium]
MGTRMVIDIEFRGWGSYKPFPAYPIPLPSLVEGACDQTSCCAPFSFFSNRAHILVGTNSGSIKKGSLLFNFWKEQKGFSVWASKFNDNKKVSNDDTAVTQRRLKDKQPEEKTNTDCLVKEQEKEYQTGWKIKTGNVLIFFNQRNMGFNESEEYKKTFIGSVVGTGSMQVLHGFEFEVEPLGDHTFEVEPQENVDQGAACELFGYREDINEAAFAVVVVEKIYAHESPTFNNTVACEVISKWKAGMKDDMDAWLDVYVLSNNDMVFSCGCKVEIWATKGLLDKAKRNVLGMKIVRDQSGYTPRVSQSRFYNRKLVQTLLEGHFILLLEGSLLGDCDVEKNDVGMLDGFDRGLQTYAQVFVNFDYAMGRSITRYGFMILGCAWSLKANLQHMEAVSTTEAGYMTFTEAWKKKMWLKGLLTESRYELRLVAGIATGALVKGGSRSEVSAQVEVAAYRLNIEKLDGNIVQKHGGSKQVGFKQLVPDVETGVHEVHDENVFGLRWNCRELKGIVKLRFFRSTQQCVKSGVAKHLGVAGIQQQNGLVYETNVTLFAKLLQWRSFMHMTTVAGNAVTTSMAIIGGIHRTLLEGHSILLLEGSLSGDCDVEKNGKWSCIYAVGSQEYQMVCTRLDISSADVESRYELRLVAGIATGCLDEGGTWTQVTTLLGVTEC